MRYTNERSSFTFKYEGSGIIGKWQTRKTPLGKGEVLHRKDAWVKRVSGKSLVPSVEGLHRKRGSE